MCFVPAGPSYTGDNKYQFSSSADTSTYEISSATTSETRQRELNIKQGVRTILTGIIKSQETPKCLVSGVVQCQFWYILGVGKMFHGKN